MAEASRFAHLFGFGAKKNAADDKDDKDKSAKGEKPTQNDGESDEDFQKRLKKWEDDQDDGESAENPKDTSDDDQDKNDKAKKALKDATDAARAEGQTAGAAAEKARWSNVLASKVAAGRGVAAISLLADTDLAAPAIEKTLAALPAETGRTTLALRQPTPTPAPSPDAPADPQTQDGPKGFAARVSAAVSKVRPSKAA